MFFKKKCQVLHTHTCTALQHWSSIQSSARGSWTRCHAKLGMSWRCTTVQAAKRMRWSKSRQLHNACQKSSGPEDSLDTRQFPVNQATWRVSLKSCMWATVHLSKNGEQLQRALHNVDVESMRKVFTTVQNRSQNLQGQELLGLTEQFG